MCSQTLLLSVIPEVKMIRLGAKKSNHHRPLKVTFDDTWKKRTFLSNLYKLKNVKKFEKISVAHDMSLEDRDESKRLRNEAKDRNKELDSTDYRFKVRGPPWAMKIVKVFSNKSTAEDPTLHQQIQNNSGY